ncbi:WD40/YVTN/BNR-like repeat-containing protein [Tahibacter caeni]|uniref:WD40/YVTN/BNR-like repeat-containing protein n=1 Tax=Tahibacter caeni TaxID=1453545 RepID=UPI0021490625|nr:hypothetical protein [Tahibacter caeni]
MSYAILRGTAAGSALALSATVASAAVGSWSTTGPAGGNVTALAVYEASPSTLWVAGRGGVFRTTSSGSAWTRIEIGLPEALYSIDLVAATATPVLYLATSNQLFRSGNGGDLWVPVAAPAGSGAYLADIALRRGTSNDLAAATYQRLHVSADGGTSWTSAGDIGGSNTQYSAIDYAADGTLYAGLIGADPAVYGGAIVVRSTSGGASWAATPTQPAGLFGISALASSPTTPQRLFASDGNAIATSANGGGSWSAIALPSSGAPCGTVSRVAAHPTLATGLVVACTTRGLLVTADATVASPVWQSFGTANGFSVNGTQPPQIAALAVHPNFPTTARLWAGAYDGGMLATSNGGTTWTAINTGFQSTNIRALATHPLDTGASTVILAGYGDSVTTTRAIYRSDDDGANWSPSTGGLNAEQIRSIAIDPTTVDADPLTAENFTVYAAGRSERLPASADKDGGLYKSTDAGANWTTIDNGIALINGRPDMSTVRTIALDPRSCVAPPPSGPCPAGSGGLRRLFAAGGGRANLSAPGLPYVSARLYRSTDAGANWSPAENGLPLPQDLGPAGANNYASMGGIVPVVFDPANTQTLYIGTFLNWAPDVPGAAPPTIANGVFKSTDGGNTWAHASSGLPRHAGAGSSHWNVLALAINPANPQILYAGLNNLSGASALGDVYKSTDGGATWTQASAGIAGQDVRALYIDPNDASGDTIYAGTGGTGANPGGVYRSTNGGVSWNSISLGLPADSATALAMPRRSAGAPARILAGTTAGVWDYTATSDEDADGAPSTVENGILGGDGNADGIQDSTQARVASLPAAGLNAVAAANGGGSATIAIQPGSCTQLNDATTLAAALYPPDAVAGAASHDAYGLASFSLPSCAGATVRVRFHSANFGPNWSWRNYGPRRPGDATTFGWYRFSGARLIDAQTWELRVDALRQGNYRDDPNDILFVGGPAESADLIFADGLQ